MKYTVVIGNIGTVYDGDSEAAARTIYASYVRSAQSGVGRAAGEQVTLFGDGEVVEEHPAASALHDPECD